MCVCLRSTNGNLFSTKESYLKRHYSLTLVSFSLKRHTKEILKGTCLQFLQKYSLFITLSLKERRAMGVEGQIGGNET